MKISEGIKLKGIPAEIPDCSRDDLPEYFKSLGFKVGVEIGVFKGDYTKVLAQSGIRIYGIDPWLAYGEYDYQRWQNYQDHNYKIAKDKLNSYPNVTLIKKTSMDALSDFEDSSIDFVYIDGNHRFKWVAEDICEWAKKVRKGGIIAGHDYAYFKHRYPGGGCQVHEVVDAFVKAYELNFWILGRKKVIAGEKRDRMRSWMIFKTWENQ